jgi:DnaK suppressor protein
VQEIPTFKLAATKRRKAALEADLRDLGRPFAQRDELQLEYFADPIDQVTSAADREIVVDRLNDRTRRIREIQDALAKFTDGSYGVCEQCEYPITPKRLDAVPSARLCVRCQSQAEAHYNLDVAA